MENEVKPKRLPTQLLAKDWSKRRCFMRGTQAFCDELHELQLRSNDVWVVTLPKCGTTWMQELVWLLLHDFDFEWAKREPLELRSPFLEFGSLLNIEGEDPLKMVEEAASPRLIKTHLPLPLLPQQLWHKKPKLIYIYRNPKDALVSAYYFRKNFGHCLDKSLQEVLLQELQNERTTEAHFQHVLEFYALRHEPWVLYTSFERMKSNLREVILEVAEFLDIAVTEQNMELMLKHLSFEEMKNNPQCNHLWEINLVRKHRQLPCEDHRFMRKGKVGGYKDELSPEFIAELDAWIEQSLAPHKLTLDDLLLIHEQH